MSSRTSITLPSQTGLLNTEEIRKDFPILHRTVHDGKPLVYLDNAATSQTPFIAAKSELAKLGGVAAPSRGGAVAGTARCGGFIVGFFRSEPPHSPKGRFALQGPGLARQGRCGRRAPACRPGLARRRLFRDLEAQARQMFAGLITPDDDKARMDARLYAEDDDRSIARRASP